MTIENIAKDIQDEISAIVADIWAENVEWPNEPMTLEERLKAILAELKKMN